MRHTADHYIHRYVVMCSPGKGQRKKREEKEKRIPWEDFNKTELLRLAAESSGTKTGRHRLWRALHRGLPREAIIRLIRGGISPGDLPGNPVHRIRDVVTSVLFDNWRHIRTQLKCNAICGQCPDAKPLECYLDNEHLVSFRDRGKLD